eukprot:4860647-Pyramimonas_sp.AAC.1
MPAALTEHIPTCFIDAHGAHVAQVNCQETSSHLTPDMMRAATRMAKHTADRTQRCEPDAIWRR